MPGRELPCSSVLPCCHSLEQTGRYWLHSEARQVGRAAASVLDPRCWHPGSPDLVHSCLQESGLDKVPRTVASQYWPAAAACSTKSWPSPAGPRLVPDNLR